MLAPEGALERLKVRVLVGKSLSDAVAVKVNSESSSIDLFPIGSNSGALLISATVTSIVSQTDKVRIVDTDIESVNSGALCFGRSPGEHAAVGINAGTGRRAGEDEGEGVGW